MRPIRLIIVLLACLLPCVVIAATSRSHDTSVLTARLITAENAIAPRAASVSAGLEVTMKAGWKTYWRSPGEVGLPPEIDWSGSENVAATDFLFPAPTRFTAFEIENFGYADQVTFPIRVNLSSPGSATTLDARVRLLVCKDICIPEDFALRLPLNKGTGIDPITAKSLAQALAKVPQEGPASGLAVEAAHLSDDSLILSISHPMGFQDPDVFPELGESVFGKPEIRLDAGNAGLWARFPVLHRPENLAPLRITLTDTGFAGTLLAPLSDSAPPEPAARRGIFTMVLIAVLGGVILNFMPCVLPVLSIKLASAVQKSSLGRAHVRAGFLWAALGVMSFFWALGLLTYLLQSLGHAVGWGLQFQNPVFLTVMIVVLGVFAANLFGLFEIQLPVWVQTRLSVAGGTGYLGDYATGAFAAVLATPCSAPFLGTAVAFALSGGAQESAAIFTALGLGLATPYLAVATFPAVVAALPKPGPWMVVLKVVMGLLLALTAAWLFFVLAGVAGLGFAAQIALIVTVALVLLRITHLPRRALLAAFLALSAIGLSVMRPMAPASGPAGLGTGGAHWAAFDEAAINRHVSDGKIVFLDITADWCLTCKANKALVLNRPVIAEKLSSNPIVAMQADWTRPDPAISAYLKRFDRYGIPFNAVFGPEAPDGIPLPELLTVDAVLDAIVKAGG